METKSIYQKLAAINKDIKAIGKGRQNVSQNFKFRGIDDVMNELHSLFAENGVLILPEVLNGTCNPCVTAGGKTSTRAVAKIKYHFVAADDGSEVEVVNIGEAMDSGDKSMNKAMSISLKYALLQMFLIPTEEQKDPDAQSPQTDYAKTLIAQINATTDAQAMLDIYNNRGPVQGTEIDLAAAQKWMTLAQSKQELMQIYNSFPQLQQHPNFTAALTQRKTQLP